jgi:tetratricopeptide (TPR) repeat protein
MTGYGGATLRALAVSLVCAVALLASGCSAATQIGEKLGEGIRAQRAFVRGSERYNAKDFAGAIPELESALIQDPAFDEAEALLAWSYYHTENYPEATRHFLRALARKPSWEGLHNGLGWSRFQVGRFHLALEAFRQALALDRGYRDAGVGYAYTLFELGRYAEALPHLERLTREGEGGNMRSVAADEEQVRSRYAWALFYLGEHTKAREQFGKGIAAHPDWSGLHNGLGWASLRLGDIARARQAFRRAVELKPDLEDAWGGLAQLER